MQRRPNDQNDRSEEDDIELYISPSQPENNLLDKLKAGISQVEEELNIPIQVDSDDQNLDLFDRILRIGSNVKSVHLRISNLILDILNKKNKDQKFIEEILNVIKENLQDSINIPTEDVEVQEAIQKIHRFAYCYVEEPEQLQKVLQQSVIIHHKSESKIKFLQGRIMDLEQQVNFFIENQDPISGNERMENEMRIKENADLKQENANLRKKYKELALQYKKISNQNNDELTNQIKSLQNELEKSKQTINNQNKELTEIKAKSTKTEAELLKFKKGFVNLKKRYDAILGSTKEKESSTSQNNSFESSDQPKEAK